MIQQPNLLTSKPYGQKRSLDDVDVENSTNATKRLHRIAEMTDSEMDDTSIVLQTVNAIANGSSTGSMNASHLPSTSVSADDILVQMVQSGCYSHGQVVDFCIEAGIPISRMLRLDLMRLSNVKP
jgi:myosin-crossreactive antigen